jgi:hypothetical protein
MPESWVQCVTRVYKQNKTKRGKDLNGKFKYKLKHAMKDAKKVFKYSKTQKGRNFRYTKKGNRRSAKKRRGGGDGDDSEYPEFGAKGGAAEEEMKGGEGEELKMKGGEGEEEKMKGGEGLDAKMNGGKKKKAGKK